MDFTSYKNALFTKIDYHFGEYVDHGNINYILPSHSGDPAATLFNNILRKHDRYCDVLEQDLIDNLDEVYWENFHLLTWEGLYILTPWIIKLSLDRYYDRMPIVETFNSLFCLIPREKNDNIHTFDDWVKMYDSGQIICIIDVMELLLSDRLKKFPYMSDIGIRFWVNRLSHLHAY